MSVEIFLILLSGFSTLTSLMVESIKKMIDDRFIVSYNLIAVTIALIIGIGGTFVYYVFNDVIIIAKDVIVAVLMGFASALCSMVGYDKVMQLINQIKM